jgi:heptosyltransferase-2
MGKINFDNVRKILVVMLGGIGDLILFVPALRALRKHLPGRTITLLSGEPGIARILDNEGLIDDVVVHDRRLAQGIFQRIKLVADMRARKFDLAVVSSATNAFKGGLLTCLMGIPRRVGENINGRGLFYSLKVDYAKGTHETDGAGRLLKAMDVPFEETLPRLMITPEEDIAISRFLTGKGIRSSDLLIGLHAGSGYRQTHKRWPKERFVHLADRLVEKYHAKVLLTGGPQEVELTAAMAQGMHVSPLNTAGQMTLRQTAAVIAKCDLFISNDSGLAHIAAAVGTEVIVLFGKTDLGRIAPRGGHVHIIRKDAPEGDNPIEMISVDEVAALADALIRKKR